MGTKEGRKIYGEFAGRFKGFYLENYAIIMLSLKD